MEVDTVEEVWAQIPDFSFYQISNLGRVFNRRRDHVMSTSLTPFGHVKISLVSDDGYRRDRSVAVLVAEAFVEAPDALCDQVVVLDGDFTNLMAYNLMWRPRWFAWKYTHQLKDLQPIQYHNLPVFNRSNSRDYRSIIEAGMAEGLLFEDIWRSTYMSCPIYPYGSIFEIVK